MKKKKRRKNRIIYILFIRVCKRDWRNVDMFISI